jgi:hypothetical protein
MVQIDLSPLIGARPGERLSFTLDEGPQLYAAVPVVSIEGKDFAAGGFAARRKIPSSI